MRAYQTRMSKFIRENLACALHVDMGMGKSVASLTAIKALLDRFIISQAIVFAPKRVSEHVWSDEVEEWAHLQNLCVVPIRGTSQERLNAMYTPADIHTISRDNTQWFHDWFVETRVDARGATHYSRRHPFLWQMIVLDESQSYKSSSSKRSLCMRNLRKLYKTRCVELTASPLPNGYEDLWMQYFLLDFGAALGQTKQSFMDRFYEPPGAYEYGPKLRPDADRQIEERIKHLTISLKQEDYLDLPPVVNNFVKVHLSPKEMGMYRKLQRDAILEFKGHKINAVNAGVLWGKLLQLANGAIYYDDKQSFEVFHDHKVDALEELLDGIPGRVIVAYNYRSDLARIQKLLSRGKRTFRLMKTDRDKDDWNDGQIDILLLHPASAGHGLNLQKSGALDFIWFGFGANLEFWKQAPARLFGGHRRQGKGTIHYITAADTKDEEALYLMALKDSTEHTFTRRMAEVVQETR